MNNWIIKRLLGTTADFRTVYPFFVEGRYRQPSSLRETSLRETSFCWHVPSVWQDGYDFSECEFIDNAALKALGL